MSMTTRQTPDAVREALPQNAPGHWDTEAGRDMAIQTLTDAHMGRSRERISDFALANEVFLSPGIANLTDAKERIRWLSASLAVALAALDSRAGDAVPSDVLPATIGRVHLGERRSDGERLCSHGHPVAAGHPLYWPVQISQYEDSDPLCLTHAIDQLESDNADWGEDYEAVDAVPVGEVERLKIAREAAASVFDEDDQTHLAAAIRAGREDHISQVQAARAALSHGEGRK